MDKLDLENQINLSYDDQLKYLKEKYGLVTGNYFLNESLRSTNQKAKRGSEGLYIHHDKEWNPEDIYCHNLSTRELAEKYPFEYQTPAYLTYCNMLEHLLLHIKIFKLRREALNNLDFIDGVESFIIPQLNDLYATKRYKKPYLAATKQAIENNYPEYLKLLDMYSKINNVDVEYLLTLSQRN